MADSPLAGADEPRLIPGDDIYDITITFSIIINEKSDEETDLFEYEEEGRRHIVFVIIQIRDQW